SRDEENTSHAAPVTQAMCRVWGVSDRGVALADRESPAYWVVPGRPHSDDRVTSLLESFAPTLVRRLRGVRVVAPSTDRRTRCTNAIASGISLAPGNRTRGWPAPGRGSRSAQLV